MADQVSLALKAIDGITPSLVNISKNLDKLTKDSARMGKDMDNAFKKMDAGAKKSSQSFSMVGAALKTATAFASIGLLKEIGQQALEGAIKWEKLGLAINTMEGGAARGADVMNQLYEAAKMPGIGLEEIQQGYLKLKGLGYEAEQSIPIFTALGNAIASTGGSAQEFESVSRQLAQMISKGRVLQEDISVMSESMPIIATLMEKAFGTSNVEKIREMGVGAREFVKGISDAAATMPKAADSMGNSIDNLSTSWSRFISGFVPTGMIKGFADFFVSEMDRMTAAAAKGEGLFGTGLFSRDKAFEEKGLREKEAELVGIAQGYQNMIEAEKQSQKLGTAGMMYLQSQKKATENELLAIQTALNEIGKLSAKQTVQAGMPMDPLAKYAAGITQVGKPTGSTALPWIEEKQGRGGYKPKDENEKARKKAEREAKKAADEARKAEEKRIDEMLESVDSWGSSWEDQYQIVGELSAKKAEEDLALDNAALEEKKKAFNLLMEERSIRSKEVEDKITEDYQNAIAVREQLSLNFANAFADSMSAAYFRAKQDGDNFFSSFLESFGLMLEQMAVQMAAKAFIFSAFSALSGGSSTVLGGAASFIFGARASGGYVANGGAYTVGENRRESFVPDRPGRIAPTSASSVTINVQAAPGMDTKQLAREIVRAQEDASRRRLRANV